MVICELCGSANNELDESCRICGQALTAHASAASVSSAAAATWPSPPSQQIPPDPAPSSSLQMSAVKQAPRTGVPPMMSERQEIMSAPTEPEATSVPSFMSSARSSSSHAEPVQLISANDLPDWIKQIAAEDEAKAAAEAQVEATADPVEQAATIVPRPLPGETQVAAPPTTWLSKSGGGKESSEHWGAAEAANANWRSPDVVVPGNQAPYSGVAPAAHALGPSTSDPYSYDKPKSWLSMPARSKSSSSASTKPIYRRQLVQLLGLFLLLAVLALILL